MATAQEGRISPDELREAFENEYSGGPFNGYDYLGYLGNHDRNYVTDAWVAEAVAVLDWTLVDVMAWAMSRHGRWALEEQPTDARHMRDIMETATPHLSELISNLITEPDED